MDVVITYVNGLDPLWQQDYERTVGKQVIAKRFRDWGTLRYLLRGIEVNMPFVRNVYLVVARDSQVPSWVNRENLHIVLHEDIIPAEFLPVFNSSSIEMFLHRIPGLDEQFVYLNDDFYPVRPCKEGDFFTDGRATIGMSRQLLVLGNAFRYLVRRSDSLAREAVGLRKSLIYRRPQHMCYCLLKSVCDELYAKENTRIMESVTPLRAEPNYNIYLFSDYIAYRGLSVNRKISNKHYSLATASLSALGEFLGSPSTDFVCINDVQMTDEKFRAYQKVILGGFEAMFPGKSAFEL